jgi:excisionase family DNA binding protein
MAKFEGGLQEWRRYIDEKTRAVRDRRDGRAAVADEEASVTEPLVEPMTEPDGAASDEVEAILAKHRAIADEINLPAPPPPAVTVHGVDPAVIEAAAMFARLPRHIQYLMRPAGDEVAQNSYKNKFSESREELILRLLDPQLSLEEAARVLNVCPTTVRRYTNRGLLKQERTPGNHRRFRMSDVLAFLEDHGASDD